LVAAIITAAGSAHPVAGAEPESTIRPAPAVIETVDTAVLHGGHIAVVVDRTGTATAVWAEKFSVVDGSARYRVRSARRFTGGRWTRPRTIGCPSADACRRTWPHLGVDGSGRVTAAWAQGRTVVAVDRPAGGRWNRPQVMSREERRVSWSDVDLAVARSGAAVVAWDVGDESFPVRAALRRAGGAWTTAVSLDDGYSPQVAVSPSGRRAIVVQDDVGR
jgi:hypothetical protein